jgi:hypothetical protein
MRDLFFLREVTALGFLARLISVLFSLYPIGASGVA